MYRDKLIELFQKIDYEWRLSDDPHVSRKHRDIEANIKELLSANLVSKGEGSKLWELAGREAPYPFGDYEEASKQVFEYDYNITRELKDVGLVLGNVAAWSSTRDPESLKATIEEVKKKLDMVEKLLLDGNYKVMYKTPRDYNILMYNLEIQNRRR